MCAQKAWVESDKQMGQRSTLYLDIHMNWFVHTVKLAQNIQGYVHTKF